MKLKQIIKIQIFNFFIVRIILPWDVTFGRNKAALAIGVAANQSVQSPTCKEISSYPRREYNFGPAPKFSPALVNDNLIVSFPHSSPSKMLLKIFFWPLLQFLTKIHFFYLISALLNLVGLHAPFLDLIWHFIEKV